MKETSQGLFWEWQGEHYLHCPSCRSPFKTEYRAEACPSCGQMVVGRHWIRRHPTPIRRVKRMALEEGVLRLQSAEKLAGVNTHSGRPYIRWEISRLTVNLEKRTAYVINMSDGRVRSVRWVTDPEAIPSLNEHIGKLEEMVVQSSPYAGRHLPNHLSNTITPFYGLALVGGLVFPQLLALGDQYGWTVAGWAAVRLLRGKTLDGGSPAKIISTAAGGPVGKIALEMIEHHGTFYKSISSRAWDLGEILSRAYRALKNPDLVRQALRPPVFSDSRWLGRMRSFREDWLPVLEIFSKEAGPKTGLRRLERLITRSNDGGDEAAMYIRDIDRMARQLQMQRPRLSEMSLEELRRLHGRLSELSRQLQYEKDEKRFSKAAARLRQYEYTSSEYGMQIVAPKRAVDIVEEGEAMDHCVASYISDTVSGRTNILFLRTTAGQRVGTLEVRQGRLVQAFGARNSRLSLEDMAFLRKWAEVMGIDMERYD